jgi:predicted type IV restriction endonuclease
MRNEADTRATLIDPRLKAAGWTDGTPWKRTFAMSGNATT